MLSAELTDSISSRSNVPVDFNADSIETGFNQWDVNRNLFLVMRDNQRRGKGCLPFYLGLMPLEFVTLGLDIGAEEDWFDFDKSAFENGSLRQELLSMRQDECSDLLQLLLDNQTNKAIYSQRLASMLTAGCMGGDHLWKDLGLNSRTQLSQLMAVNFKPLFDRNDKDMKWKKFFYKQLCEQEGGYVCRAPTCEQCAAYDDCFGPEN